MELQFYAPGFAPLPTSRAAADQVVLGADHRQPGVARSTSPTSTRTARSRSTSPTCRATAFRPGRPARSWPTSTPYPNAQTLMFNPGDVLKVSISDPATGFTTRLRPTSRHHAVRLHGGQRGNGFMNTNFPTARHAVHLPRRVQHRRQQNQVPWAALEGGVLMQQEIGHGEVCGSLATRTRSTRRAPRRQPDLRHLRRRSPRAAMHHRGRGPLQPDTGVCKGATTEGTQGPACLPEQQLRQRPAVRVRRRLLRAAGNPHGDAERQACEGNLAGQLLRRQPVPERRPGLRRPPYRKTSWPNGTASRRSRSGTPGRSRTGTTYPKIQFETDAPGQSPCATSHGRNCVAPPLGAKFYPFFTLTNKAGQGVGNGLFPPGACIWNFGYVSSASRRTTWAVVPSTASPTSHGTADNISAPQPNPESREAARRSKSSHRRDGAFDRRKRGSAPGRVKLDAGALQCVR